MLGLVVVVGLVALLCWVAWFLGGYHRAERDRLAEEHHRALLAELDRHARG